MRKPAAVFLGCLAGVLAAEIGLRAVGHGPKLAADVDTPEAYFCQPDRDLGWRNREYGYHANLATGSVARTGRYGLRLGPRDWDEGDAASPVVLFAGDSTTFCAEVEDDETGAAEVSQLAGVTCLNVGVRGYDTRRARMLSIEWAKRLPGLKLVVYTLCGNDIGENITGRDMREPSRLPEFLALANYFAAPGVAPGYDLDIAEFVLTDELGFWVRGLAPVKLLVVPYPIMWWDGKFTAMVARACKTAGAEWRDISSAFDFNRREIYYARRSGSRTTWDPHFGKRGTRTYGSAVAPLVCELLR